MYLRLTPDPAERPARETRGANLAARAERPIVQSGKDTWVVPSEKDARKSYVVTRYASNNKEERFTCTCPDHAFRGMGCKHAYAVLFVRTLAKAAPQAVVAPEPVQVALAPLPEPIKDGRPSCKFCASEHVVKVGTKSGSQQYRCKTCARKFVPPSGFERIQADPKAVCLALDLSFKGLSLRKVTDTLNQFYALDVGKSTVQRWLDRYVTVLNEYADTLQPQVGNKWHADEVFTKFSGKMQYVWHLMDAKTRYLLVSRVTPARTTDDARAVFTEARAKAAKSPAEVVTDGLPAYKDAFDGSFNASRTNKATVHTREIHLSKPNRYPENNRVERLNGTFRERQKVTRGLKKPSGPLTRGHAAYYNLLRPHQALGGKTPAEAAGVARGGGEPRWERAIRARARADV